MARIRTVKPEFWKHEDLSALPEPTHMLACALLNYADDEGYFNANPQLIKSELFPLREPSVSIQHSLTFLVEIGYLRLGIGEGGRRFGQIVKFSEHQRINRKTESKIKQIEIIWDEDVSTHAQLSEPSHPEGKGREQGKEGNSVTVVTGAEAPKSPDLKTVLFGECLQWLAPRGPKDMAGARRVVGKWISLYGEGPTLHAFMAAQRASAPDPIAYITKVLNGKRSANSPHKTDADAAAEAIAYFQSQDQQVAEDRPIDACNDQPALGCGGGVEEACPEGRNSRPRGDDDAALLHAADIPINPPGAIH